MGLAGAAGFVVKKGASMSTPNKILTALADANGVISLGLEVAGVVVPLVKGAITEIRKLGTSTSNVTYQVVLEVDATELDSIDKLAVDDLTAINAELAARGITPVPIAPPSTES